MTDPNRNMLWARAIAEEAVRSGVGSVSIAPGSRSGPLACAFADLPGLQVFVHADERSAGFFASGWARATRRPAAVLTTSGTAAANLLPAMVEAYHARLPMLAITADRPPEAHGCGAPQTTRQSGLFASHVRETADLPVPEPTGPMLRAARATVCRLVDKAMGPPAGPVHLNCPLRNPLDQREVPGDVPADLTDEDPIAVMGRGPQPFVRFARRDPTAPKAAVERLSILASESPRGLIVAGPDDRTPGMAEGVAALARATGWPVLADALSPLRAGAPEGVLVLSAHDAFLRSDRFARSHAPDLVVRFGAPPTSRALADYLEIHKFASHVIVDPDGALDDPSHLGPEVLRADPAALGRAVAEGIHAQVADSAFASSFICAEETACGALDAAAGGPWFEAGIVRAMDVALPTGAMLFAGNSMPVRDIDLFLPASPRPLRVMANRGANGIDGVVSSALGAMAAIGGGPGVLFIGDVSLLHDAGGLAAAGKYAIPLVIVAVHNDGGGVFHHLPVHGTTPHFERLFAAPHGLELGPLAGLYGLAHASPYGPSFREAFERAIGSGRPCLIEVRLDREESARLRREALASAIQAVETAP